MFLEHLSGLLRSRYFPNPVGDIPLVVDEFEDSIVVGFPRFFAGQDGEPVVGVPDGQVIREAAVQVPSGADEAVFYLFLRHLAPLSQSTRYGLTGPSQDDPKVSYIVALMSKQGESLIRVSNPFNALSAPEFPRSP